MRGASPLVAVLLAAGSLVAAIGLFVPSARGTDVPGGWISVDTTWTKAGSPYVILGNVSLGVLVTLTIDPGVEVLFAGNYSLDGGGGVLFANGSAADPISFRPQTDNGRPWQWGALHLSSGHDVRVQAAKAVEICCNGPQGLDHFTIDSGFIGLSLYAAHDAHVSNVTIRHVMTDALELPGTANSCFSNVTIDWAQTGIALLHIGEPMTGASPRNNVLTHIAVSNVTDGLTEQWWFYPPPPSNLLTHSVFRDVAGTVFPDLTSVTVYGNNFINTSVDFGFGSGGVGQYDDGARGNYWSNYTGTDGDGDGIGDTPYGPDRFPLMHPFTTGGPPAPASVRPAVLAGAALADVKLSWVLSSDDVACANDVVAYEVWTGATYDASGTTYTRLASVPRGTTTYTDAGAGVGDPASHYYQIRTVDASGRWTASREQAAKYVRDLAAGMQLVSVPLEVADWRLDAVFQTVPWTLARTFVNPPGTNAGWRMDDRQRAADFTSMDRGMGLWILVDANASWTIAGLVPANTAIALHSGWNLIGFPRVQPLLAGNLFGSPEVRALEGWDAVPPYYLRLVSLGETLEPGSAYWVEALRDLSIAVPN